MCLRHLRRNEALPMSLEASCSWFSSLVSTHGAKRLIACRHKRLSHKRSHRNHKNEYSSLSRRGEVPPSPSRDADRVHLAPRPQRIYRAAGHRTWEELEQQKFDHDFVSRRAEVAKQLAFRPGQRINQSREKDGNAVVYRASLPSTAKRNDPTAREEGELTPLLRAILSIGEKSKLEQSKLENSSVPVRQRKVKFIPRHHTQVSTGNPRYDALGRTLCRILRHQAVELGMKVRADGYIRMDELLALNIRTHAGIPMRAHTVEEVMEIVNKDPKRRYSTLVEDGVLYVRANQGHSMEIVQSEKLLKEIKSAEEAAVCVHGTFRCYWPSIARVGLSRMGRNHVHFASGLPNDEGILSGMQDSCEVLIYLDVRKALRDGMKLFVSENGVLLTEGFGGIIPVEYFAKVVEWPSGLPVPLTND